MIQYKVIRIPAEELPDIADFETWLKTQAVDGWIFTYLYPNRVAIFKKYS